MLFLKKTTTKMHLKPIPVYCSDMIKTYILLRILRSACTNVDDPAFMSSAPAPLLQIMDAYRSGFEGPGCSPYDRGAASELKCSLLERKDE